MFSITQPMLTIPRKSPSDAGALLLGSYKTKSNSGAGKDGSPFEGAGTSGVLMYGGNIVPKSPTFFLTSSCSEKESC
jgi:hypothetical protein